MNIKKDLVNVLNNNGHPDKFLVDWVSGHELVEIFCNFYKDLGLLTFEAKIKKFYNFYKNDEFDKIQEMSEHYKTFLDTSIMEYTHNVFGRIVGNLINFLFFEDKFSKREVIRDILYLLNRKIAQTGSIKLNDQEKIMNQKFIKMVSFIKPELKIVGDLYG